MRKRKQEKGGEKEVQLDNVSTLIAEKGMPSSQMSDPFSALAIFLSSFLSNVLPSSNLQ